ncbi:response regulator transcription factor [Parahaliea mediterranea]|uniref:Response regulator transcription factor n=1 Tax=Parahaliea mediterranea TaxID=651086 RepID=A0A939DF67_9GAMM|nr:response regulator transcription factor [Parahaliea mediterranea]MBN7796944.1 response regulator transcription factor [Parahaliea mediterranea]
MATILIVEDDVDIAQGIAEFLEVQGHTMDFAYNGRQALNLLSDNDYQLILLDLNLPFVDGLDVCRSLLAGSLTQVPVIIMSARADEQDILEGFDSGAWDYLIKPYSFAELSARIKANLAKVGTVASTAQQTVAEGATLNHQDMSLHFDGRSLQLHQVGFEILRLLMEHAPATVRARSIHQALWGGDTPESDPLRAHIYKLRKQLAGQFGQKFIYTVKGVGYKFAPERQVDDLD